MNRLLADNRQTGLQPRETFAEECLAIPIRDRDGIAAAFVLDLTLGQIAKSGEDRSPRRLVHQITDGVVELAHDR